MMTPDTLPKPLPPPPFSHTLAVCDAPDVISVGVSVVSGYATVFDTTR